SVLIIGAGGYIGRVVAQEFLSQKSKFARVAILSDESKVGKFAEIAKGGMEVVIGSFLEPSSFKGFTTIICMLGNHAMKHQPAIIDAAVTVGATNFYPSEFGSDISQGAYLSNRYFRDKHITREHLAKVAEQHKGFGYTLIVTGSFAEYAAHPAFGIDPEKGTFDFFGPKEKKEPFTGILDIAKYVVASVLMLESNNQTETPCRTFRIPTATYTWEEVIETLSRVQGKNYICTYHPTSDAHALAHKYAREGDVDKELGYSLKAIIGDPNEEGVPKPWDHDKFPDIHPERLEVSLRRHFG
ncbi:NAD(P)-binding protein, partial [Stipitochalara longipes BDJ]